MFEGFEFPGGPLYYDRQGQPIEMMTWGALLQDHDYKRVAATHVGRRVWVSTVWLGLDHAMPFLGERAPKIFETMVFGGIHDDYLERYGTEAEAQLGHRDMVKGERRWWVRYLNLHHFHPRLVWWLLGLGVALCWFGVAGSFFIVSTPWWAVASFIGGVMIGLGCGEAWKRRRLGTGETWKRRRRAR